MITKERLIKLFLFEKPHQLEYEYRKKHFKEEWPVIKELIEEGIVKQVYKGRKKVLFQYIEKSNIMTPTIIENLLKAIPQEVLNNNWYNKELKTAYKNAKDNPSIETLEELMLAIPGQTEDADWWPDELTDAYKAAEELLNQQPC